MLENYKSIFFVGIKGVAMANLARMCKQMGKKVTGSDVKDTFITDDELKSAKIIIIYSFKEDELPSKVDLVVYSAAHGGTNNPQVKEALKRGITVKHQAEVIGELMKSFYNSVAVAGCHGKTTTSSYLAYALSKLKQKPSYLVGVSSFNDMYGGEYKDVKYLVLEADEYGVNPPENKTPKFNFFNPTHLLVTNIDFDHPDVYKNLEETKLVFLRFIQKILGNPHATVVACIDDKPLHEVLTNILSERIITYGTHPHAHVRLVSIHTHNEVTDFEVELQQTGNRYSFETSLFGEKNILNATGVVAMLLKLNFPTDKIQKAVKGFTGAKRRFELKRQAGDTYLFDDYGHHPHEIEATIQAAKMRFPGKRIVVIFQPHTFSRTESLKEEFIRALSQADKAYILPIFASAREQQTPTITSGQLVQLAHSQGIHFIHSYEDEKDLLHVLREDIKQGDIVFTMGAGDVYKMEEKIGTIIDKI